MRCSCVRVSTMWARVNPTLSERACPLAACITEGALEGRHACAQKMASLQARGKLCLKPLSEPTPPRCSLVMGHGSWVMGLLEPAPPRSSLVIGYGSWVSQSLNPHAVHWSWVMGHGSLRACTPALFIGQSKHLKPSLWSIPPSSAHLSPAKAEHAPTHLLCTCHRSRTRPLLRVRAPAQRALDSSNEQLRVLRERYDSMVQERDVALGLAQEAQKSEAQVQAELMRVKVGGADGPGARIMCWRGHGCVCVHGRIIAGEPSA